MNNLSPVYSNKKLTTKMGNLNRPLTVLNEPLKSVSSVISNLHNFKSSLRIDTLKKE
jgi:hypothetical protein